MAKSKLNKWVLIVTLVVGVISIIGAGWTVTVEFKTHFATAEQLAAVKSQVDQNSDSIRLNKLEVLVDSALSEWFSMKQKKRQYPDDEDIDQLLIKSKEEYDRLKEELRALKQQIAK